MKKTWIIIGVIVVILAIILIVTQTKKEEDVIKIGAILPLTGSAAIWGENAKMGMEIALEEINENGEIKGRKIELIFEDSQSDPSRAVSALQKLISNDGVQVVIGDIASSSVLAMAPIAEKAKVVLLSPGASNPDISHAGEYIFRNWQSDALEGEINARYAYEKLGYKRISILYVNNAYGAGLKTVFERIFNNLGGTILIKETFEQGAIDFRTQIAKISRSKPDAIFMPGYPPEMALILKQSKEMGIKVKFLSVQAFDDTKIIEVAKDASEGVIFSIPKPPDTSETTVSKFIQNYRKKYKREPGVCSDTGYDALKIIVWALNRISEVSGPAIKDELVKLKNFQGAAGITTFDTNGDVIKPFVFKTVNNGKMIELK